MSENSQKENPQKEKGLIGLARDLAKGVPPNLRFFALILMLLVIAGESFGFKDAIKRGDTIGIIAAVGVFVVVLVAMLLGFATISTERKKREQSDIRRDDAERRLSTQETGPDLDQLTKRLLSRDQAKEAGIVAWVRLLPRIPLPQDVLKNLQTELEVLRGSAATILADIGANISADLVRANIFLPDTRRAEVGQVCGLFIPKSLHVNMQDIKERELVFRPDEGLTGRVFVQEEAQGAIFTPGDHIWRRVTFFGAPPDPQNGFDFTLTEYQQKLISVRLRWVVSFPLKVPDGREETTVGVVNVDGLDKELLPEKMKELFLRLVTSEIPKFSTILAGGKFDRIGILVARGN
jgi:hypothetical protein